MFRRIDKQKGFTLVEVLVALAIFSIVALLIFAALSVGTRAVLQSDLRTNARSLAVSRIEAVMAASYANAPAGSVTDYAFDPIPSGFDIYTLDRDGSTWVKDHVFGVPWDLSASAAYLPGELIDPGIQKISVIITLKDHDPTEDEKWILIRLDDFKVNR